MFFVDYIPLKIKRILENERENGFEAFTDITETVKKRLLTYESYSFSKIKDRRINKRPAIEIIEGIVRNYITNVYKINPEVFFLESYLEEYHSSDRLSYKDHDLNSIAYMNDYNKVCELEMLEEKFLRKFTHFLLFAKDENLDGLSTQNRIRNDWYPQWTRHLEKDSKKGISDFSVGAERIIYSLLNGKGVGIPNSSPIGSDLFFETKDAFI